MSKQIIFGALGVVGALLAISGTVIICIIPSVFESKIREALRLVNNTEAFKLWQKAPIPVTMKFTIFHLNNSATYTNLDDIQLVEKGPYVYEEFRSKENIHFDRTGEFVSYNERRQYKYRPDLTNGHSDDNVTIINLPILGVIFNQALPEGKLGYTLFKSELDTNEKGLFTTRKVGELLFDGLDLKLFNMAAPLLPKDSGISLGTGKFSLGGGKDQLMKEMIVHTGRDENYAAGEFFKYDNKRMLQNDDPKHTPVWPYHQDTDLKCNEIRGSDGSGFGPSITKESELYAFDPSICRSIKFSYLEESEVLGIRTLRFGLPKQLFDSPKKHKPNACFCLSADLDQCQTNGLLELSHCLGASGGVPVSMSTPYFLSGDEHLRTDITLVPPKPLTYDNYGSFVDIDPMTGAVLSALKRMQVNIRIKHDDSIPQLNATKSGKNYVVPVMWIEQKGEILEEHADMFRNLHRLRAFLKSLSIALIVIGALMLIAAPALVIKVKKAKTATTIVVGK